jgi:hypothetical protein
MEPIANRDLKRIVEYLLGNVERDPMLLLVLRGFPVVPLESVGDHRRRGYLGVPSILLPSSRPFGALP